MSLRWLLSEGTQPFNNTQVPNRIHERLTEYRGTVLWNTVCYCEQAVGRSSLNNLKKCLLTTLRNSNLTFFPLLLLVLYIPIFFLLRSYNNYHLLFSNSSYIYKTCDFPFFFTRPHKLVA